VYGGNKLSRSLDTKKGFEDYVRLAFNTKHPMAWHLTQKERHGVEPVWIEVDLGVVNQPGVLFSNMNATTSKTELKVIHTPQHIRISYFPFIITNYLFYYFPNALYRYQLYHKYIIVYVTMLFSSYILPSHVLYVLNVCVF
jgi:hypothetical protein